MIDRVKVQGNHESGNASGQGDEDQPALGIAVGRSGFVVEEALKEVTHKKRELAAVGHTHRAQRSLGI